MSTFNKTTSIYILILLTGIIIISSLMEMIFTLKTENTSTTWYCGTVMTDIYGEPLKLDSLNEKQEEIAVQGKELFEGNCAQCHSIHKKIVGPALAGVESRWESEEQLIEFIKYPEQTIQKNEYAQNLYQEYGQIMPNHDFFDDEMIKSILFYIKYQSGENVYVELVK